MNIYTYNAGYTGDGVVLLYYCIDVGFILL